jgi:hypothetical protein
MDKEPTDAMEVLREKGLDSHQGVVFRLETPASLGEVFLMALAHEGLEVSLPTTAMRASWPGSVVEVHVSGKTLNLRVRRKP